MSIFDSEIEYKPIEETIKKSSGTQKSDKMTVGTGSRKWEVNIKEGMWLGAETFEDAPMKFDFFGNATFSSVTIKNSSGAILIDSNSTTQDYVHVLNTKLNTDSAEILSDFDFGSVDYAGAVKAGDITWNTSTGAVTGGSGVVVYRNGIVGAKAGSTTFSINTNGDATFKGTVVAGSILSAGDIQAGGTITGVNVVSSSGSNSIRLTNGDLLEFYYGGVRQSYARADASGDFHLVAVDDIVFSAGGADRCGIHGNEFRPHSNGTYELGSASYLWEKVHSYEYDVGSTWKITASGDQLYFKYGATEYMRLNGSKIRPAGTYESSDGTDGTNHSGYGFVNGIRWDGGTLQYRFSEIEVKDGLVVGFSEQDWEDVPTA